MRLLTITNLYPGGDMPRHGIFVEERLRHLVDQEAVRADVIALRPAVAWKATQKVRNERRHGIEVAYLPIPTIPLVTNWIDPLIWARRIEGAVRSRVGDDDDVILDAHFLYPDGVAVALAGRKLGLPVVMTARGSDVNVKCENPVMRRWVTWAASHSAATITVSQALADRLQAIGVAPGKLSVLRNGVDLEKFRPMQGDSLDSVGGDLLKVLSIGHLVEGKGHHRVIEAIADVPRAHLTIVGEGPWEARLRSLAETLGVEQRVNFRGYVPHDRLASIYSAADVTVLASRREGMPNVILESLACGTRVLATDVGGVSEVITAPETGLVVNTNDSATITEGLKQLAASPADRAVTRRYAERNLGWATTVAAQRRLYDNVLAAARASSPQHHGAGTL